MTTLINQGMFVMVDMPVHEFAVNECMQHKTSTVPRCEKIPNFQHSGIHNEEDGGFCDQIFFCNG